MFFILKLTIIFYCEKCRLHCIILKTRRKGKRKQVVSAVDRSALVLRFLLPLGVEHWLSLPLVPRLSGGRCRLPRPRQPLGQVEVPPQSGRDRTLSRSSFLEPSGGVWGGVPLCHEVPSQIFSMSYMVQASMGTRVAGDRPEWLGRGTSRAAQQTHPHTLVPGDHPTRGLSIFSTSVRGIFIRTSLLAAPPPLARWRVF